MTDTTTLSLNTWPAVDQLERVAALVFRATARPDVSASAAWTCNPTATRVLPLRGGLESAAVARIAVSLRAVDRRQHVTFVVKRLQGERVREAAVYRWLTAARCAHLAPACFAIEPAVDEGHWLFLEALRPVTPWPWRDLDHVSSVVDALADLHESGSAGAFTSSVPEFDYDAELRRRGRCTAETFHAARTSGAAWLRPYGPALRRVLEALPAMRRQTAAASGFGWSVLHGDVHSRNLVICRRGPATRAVFADWGRARCGSPLEDVSSWLHSLGFWEPEARRRHDTLLKRYFERRGRRDALSRSIRDAVWLASATNALAGALDYHLWSMSRPAVTARQREAAAGAARDWLRIIRRADAVWRMGTAVRPGRRDAHDRRTRVLLATLSPATTQLS
jgi:Ser/Thr protein kinase RdoA (MazF antagonist)